MPADWMMVAMPQVSRSALMRWTSVWLHEPEAGSNDERDDHGARVEREDVLNA